MKKILLPILFSTILIKTAPTKASFYTTFDFMKLDSVYRFGAKIGKNFTRQFDTNISVAFQEDTDSTRDGVSFLSLYGAYKFNPKYSPAVFASITKSVSKNVGDFTLIDLGYKMASKFKAGPKYDMSTNLNYARMGSQDSFNFVIGGNLTFDLNKQLSLTTGADFTLNNNFHLIKNIIALNKSSLLAKIQLNYYYHGLWNLYYNNVLGESVNIFGLKYSRSF